MKVTLIFLFYILAIVCLSFIIVTTIRNADKRRNNKKNGKTDFNNDFKL